MTDFIDPIHFQELAGLDPDEVCERALCNYDAVGKYYALSVWGQGYRIFPHDSKIDCIEKKHQEQHGYFHLFMVHYLLGARKIELSGNWISEKDIPGGATFFRGPHEIPTHLIATRYGSVDQFRRQCAQYNGTTLDMADAAYAFAITPRIPAAVLYWAGDDEFPAEAKIRYDRTITAHLASDIVYALAVAVCERLGQP